MSRGEWALWVGIVVYALLTAHRVRVWRSDVSLWRDAVHTAPCLGRPYLRLGLAEAEAGHPAAATQAWERATFLFTVGRCDR